LIVGRRLKGWRPSLMAAEEMAGCIAVDDLDCVK